MSYLLLLCELAFATRLGLVVKENRLQRRKSIRLSQTLIYLVVFLQVGCVTIDSRGIALQAPSKAIPKAVSKPMVTNTTKTQTVQTEATVAEPVIILSTAEPPTASTETLAPVKPAEIEKAIISAKQATKPIAPPSTVAVSQKATVAVTAPTASAVDIAHSYKYKVRGEEYGVFKSSENFQEIGTASWYGPGFHGKLTANGERFDMNAMTAAHKTLPLGSWVEVSNLNNGLKVTVRINDRGPFRSGRIIDLSKKAAQQLGIFRRGHGRVHIKIVKGE